MFKEEHATNSSSLQQHQSSPNIADHGPRGHERIKMAGKRCRPRIPKGIDKDLVVFDGYRGDLREFFLEQLLYERGAKMRSAKMRSS